MDPNEEEKKRKKSAIDHVNDTANRGRDAYRTAKRVQGAIKFARGAGAAAEGAEAATGAVATSEVWVPVLLIALLVLLIIMVLIAILGGSVQENIVGNAPTCESIGGACGATCASPNIPDASGALCSASNDGQNQICCVPPDAPSSGCSSMPSCPTGEYLSCLKNQFGITMKGGYSLSDLRIIFEGFGEGFRFPTFLAWFKSVHPTVVVSSYSECPSTQWCAGAWATVQPGALMTLYQNFLNAGSRYKKYVLVHEAGHMAAQANSKASNSQYTLYENAYVRGVNRNCYNSIGIIDTYPWRVISSSQLNYARKVRESWAESIADTVLCPANASCPSNGGGGRAIYNFPSTCSYIYNYIAKALGC